MRGALIVIAVVAFVAIQLASSAPANRCGCGKKSKSYKSKDCCDCDCKSYKTKDLCDCCDCKSYKSYKTNDLCDCDCLTAIQSAPPLPKPPPPPCNCKRCNSPCDDLAEYASYGQVSFHKSQKPPCHDIYGAIDLPPPPAPACCNPVPADAVSVALALERAQKAQKKVLEENLSFGPMQKPLNGAVCKSKKFVPEAGLHALRQEVVELLPTSRFKGLTPEEEAEASMLAALQLQGDLDLDYASELYGPILPTYYEIGYVPVPPGCNSAFVAGASNCGCSKNKCNCKRC